MVFIAISLKYWKNKAWLCVSNETNIFELNGKLIHELNQSFQFKIVYYSLATQITILSWDAAQGYFHSSFKVLSITTDNSKSQIKRALT